MLGGLFDAISSVVSDFASLVGDGLTAVASLFYSYDSTAGLQLTFIGNIAIIAVGAGLVWLVYRLIKGAIRGIGR